MQMNKLISILTAGTQEVKDQFLKQTEDWANRHFDVVTQRNKWTAKDWCKYFRLEPLEYKTFDGSIKYKMPKNFFNTSDARTYDKMTKEAQKIVNIGKNQYIKMCLKSANEHYESSVSKLAARVIQKGLNINNLKITNARVGQNIDVTITDGVRKIKAQTIFAHGMINAPHFRYLVK